MRVNKVYFHRGGTKSGQETTQQVQLASVMCVIKVRSNIETRQRRPRRRCRRGWFVPREQQLPVGHRPLSNTGLRRRVQTELRRGFNNLRLRILEGKFSVRIVTASVTIPANKFARSKPAQKSLGNVTRTA